MTGSTSNSSTVAIPTWVAISWLGALLVLMFTRTGTSPIIERKAGAALAAMQVVGRARVSDQMGFHFHDTATVPADQIAPPPDHTPAEGRLDSDKPATARKYGFYLHVFDRPAAVIHQVFSIQKHFPGSPIYIMSDGGVRFDGLCQKVGVDCTFKLCPPANDRWHPWPFLHRLRTAASVMDTEYVIMLEPDNTVHGPITHPMEFDAGGLHEDNPRFGERIVSLVEAFARKTKPDFKWLYHGSGLAGGTYFRSAAILDAFADEKVAAINFTHMRNLDSARVFSSDFAMPIALSMAGYTYSPWNDSISWGLGNQPNVSVFAFEHYRRNVEGGKPEYNRRIETWQDEALSAPPLAFFQKGQKFAGPVFNSRINCQMCWNASAYWHAYKTYDCANPIDVGVYDSAFKARLF